MSIQKYLKGAAVALSALVLTSCASDYLDTPTHGSIGAEQICDTPESARQALLGAASYAMIVPWDSEYQTNPAQALMQGESGFSYYIGEIPGPDNYVNFIYTQAPSWVSFYNQVDTYLSSGGYVWNTTYWVWSYAMIAQLNEIIESMPNCNIGADGSGAALRDFTEAQARALRAHAYWRLLSVYAARHCDSNNEESLAVVLRTSPSDPQNKAVSTWKEVIEQCYTDLNRSIELFQQAGKSFRTLNYEPDLAVAYGIFARVAALREDWATCKTMAHNARQGKRMETKAEAFSGYLSYNTNEWLWAPSFDQVDNWIYGNWCTFHACNGYAALNANYTNSINRDLYKLIPEEDARRDWWMTYDKLPGTRPAQFYMPTMVNPETGAIKNKRLLDAAKSWLNDHKPSTVTGNDAYALATNSDKTTATIRDGAQIKFWCNGDTGQEGMGQIPFMRAAEMYLLEAEACAMLGQSAEAQNLLVDINKNFNPNYTCSLTGQSLIDEVRLYTRIELWGEGHNWFLFKRWNIPMHRTAWKANDVNSGNIPTGLACDVPVTQNHGWRHGIPYSERNYNDLVNEPIPGVLQ